MDWYSARQWPQLTSDFPRVVDVSTFGGDLQCAVDQLTTVEPNVRERDQQGGLIYIPPGCTAFVRHPPLVIASGQGRRRDNVRIVGSGPTSRIAPVAADWPRTQGGGPEVERALLEIRGYESAGAIVSAQDWSVENLRLDGCGLPGAVGLRLHKTNQVDRIRNLWITDCPGAGVVVQHNSNANVLDGLVIERCGEGIRMPLFLPWEEYRKDLVLYRPPRPKVASETRYLCNREDIPHVAPPRRSDRFSLGALHVGCADPWLRRLSSSACCGGCPAPSTAAGCCRRAPDAPELGCWARNDTYRCKEFVFGRTEAELVQLLGSDGWHVRHPGALGSTQDLREQPGAAGPGNSVTILNCTIRSCERNGIRTDDTTNVRLVNCNIIGSRGHGLTAHYCTALRVEGCLFEDNGAQTPAAEAGDAYGHAQVIIGDIHRHDPDPPRTDARDDARGSPDCTGVQLIASQFRCTPDGGGGDVGVYVAYATGTSLMGCLFDGHEKAAVRLEDGAERTVLMSSIYRGRAGVDGSGRDTEDYDRALA